MVSTPTPPSLAIIDPRPLAGSSVLVRPFDRIELQPPSQTSSGLFPALDEEPVPVPVARGGLRLRRAVLLTIVVGAVGLLAYASWQRASRASPPRVIRAR